MKPPITTNAQSNNYSFKQMYEVLKQYLSQIKLTYSVKSLGIFGSFVREEATENSDLDILVEFEGEPTFRKYMDLKFFLEDLFERQVDLVIETDIKPQIREQILEEVVYVS
ncbi:nucleotidyltransferase family protein [Crocosphaera sp.]|uniref:nucleotidyltransferase family protein n=1 Tax=Crocosphaera sp. TaxID=2729996 RepID=UPI003F24ACD0